jgi:hypothetical protein
MGSWVVRIEVPTCTCSEAHARKVAWEERASSRIVPQNTGLVEMGLMKIGIHHSFFERSTSFLLRTLNEKTYSTRKRRR